MPIMGTRPRAKIGATPPRWSAKNRDRMALSPLRVGGVRVPCRFYRSVKRQSQLILKLDNYCACRGVIRRAHDHTVSADNIKADPTTAVIWSCRATLNTSARAATIRQGIDTDAGDGFSASATANAKNPDVSQKSVGANSEACRMSTASRKKPCVASPRQQVAANAMKIDAISLVTLGRWLEARHSAAARHNSKTTAHATRSIAGFPLGNSSRRQNYLLAISYFFPEPFARQRERANDPARPSVSRLV